MFLSSAMNCPHLSKPQANENDCQANPKPNQHSTTGGSASDPRLEQLIVYRALLKHLLHQKIHYDWELQLEEQRLERFRHEGLNEKRLKVQERVVINAQAMLPGIVFKMRNEVDRLQRMLDIHQQQLRQLDLTLYEQCQQLVQDSKQSLDDEP
ncbi:tubulin-specific chaperone A [Drosophila guanche]|uniref:tubulin-specific chaperone A n=1 Tax=Drosophila guanche TaxID=7266 RepID=UPI001470F307|nr:tubulin-specific chaperone A [Drosophila guanche]